MDRAPKTKLFSLQRRGREEWLVEKCHRLRGEVEEEPVHLVAVSQKWSVRPYATRLRWRRLGQRAPNHEFWLGGFGKRHSISSSNSTWQWHSKGSLWEMITRVALNNSGNSDCRRRIATGSCGKAWAEDPRLEQQDLGKKQKSGLLDSIYLRELRKELRKVREARPKKHVLSPFLERPWMLEV